MDLLLLIRLDSISLDHRVPILLDHYKHYIELLKETPSILFSIIREAEKASEYILNLA